MRRIKSGTNTNQGLLVAALPKFSQPSSKHYVSMPSDLFSLNLESLMSVPLGNHLEELRRTMDLSISAERSRLRPLCASPAQLQYITICTRRKASHVTIDFRIYSPSLHLLRALLPAAMSLRSVDALSLSGIVVL